MDDGMARPRPRISPPKSAPPAPWATPGDDGSWLSHATQQKLYSSQGRGVGWFLWVSVVQYGNVRASRSNVGTSARAVHQPVAPPSRLCRPRAPFAPLGSVHLRGPRFGAPWAESASRGLGTGPSKDGVGCNDVEVTLSSVHLVELAAELTDGGLSCGEI